MVIVKEHSVSLMLAFRPVRTLLMSIGQMPFVERRRRNNTIVYKCTMNSFLTPLFVVVFTFAATNFLLLTIGIVNVILKSSPLSFGYKPKTQVKFWKPQFREAKDEKNIELAGFIETQMDWEEYHVQRQVIPIIVIWTWMMSAIVGGIYVIIYGHSYTHFFNYWHRVVQAMDMDVTRGIRQHLYIENCVFLGVITGVITAFLLGAFLDFNLVADIARVMANFVLRNFHIEIAAYQNNDSTKAKFWLCNVFGLFIIIFAYAGSRTNIVQFVFFCRSLTNACTLFNERLLTVMTEEEVVSETIADEIEKRKVHARLFRDHLIIVQLFRMTNSLFAPILLPYYLSQVVVITLQLYNLLTLRKISKYEVEAAKYMVNATKTVLEYRAILSDNELMRLHNYLVPENQLKEDAERLDTIQRMIVSIAFVAQGWIFLTITTSTAARAADAALAAFKIVRRNGYITCETKKERNLMHSLIFSFARSIPIQLTAGGFFAINMALIPAIVGTILNYIVAANTVRPDVWNENPPELLPKG